MKLIILQKSKLGNIKDVKKNWIMILILILGMPVLTFKRLLKLEFEKNHSIKSKCLKYVVKEILPTL